MPIRLANRRFSPTLLGTALVIVGVALFVRLGFWQLHRAEEKQELLAQYAAGQQSTVDLTAANAAALPTYQQITARGHYDPAQQILLDNMPSQHGQPGYRVITPFRLESGDWLLVDRGWLALGATRADIPDVSVGAEARTITGRLDTLPRAGIQLDAANEGAAAAWPRVMSFPQHAALERALNRQLLPGLALLDPAQADGYERVWQARFQFGPDRHIAYAVQWFALAAAAAVIYLIMSLQRERSDDRSFDQDTDRTD